jgi:hypothetical protein
MTAGPIRGGAGIFAAATVRVPWGDASAERRRVIPPTAAAAVGILPASA